MPKRNILRCELNWVLESESGKRNIDERIISRRDDFVVDVLFYFTPVQRFEYPGDMFSFGVLVTAQARKFCNSWRGHICFSSKIM